MSVTRPLYLKSPPLASLTAFYSRFSVSSNKRAPFVSIDDKTQAAAFGVIRESLIGPLLFAVYVDEAFNLVPRGVSFLFADDKNSLLPEAQ